MAGSFSAYPRPSPPHVNLLTIAALLNGACTSCARPLHLTAPDVNAQNAHLQAVSATQAQTPSPPAQAPTLNALPTPEVTPAPCTSTAEAASGTPSPLLDAPAPWQVLQRRGNGTARARIEGRLAGTRPACIEALVFKHGGAIGASPAASVVQSWRALSVSWDANVPQAFTAELSLPQGGWFDLALRAVDADGKRGPAAIVERVAAGEVFVTAGQSNSTYWGAAPQTTLSGMVSTFDGNSWNKCQDPIVSVDGGRGGSTWCLLGDLLYARWKVPVAFAPVGWGGTSIKQWQENGVVQGQEPGLLRLRLGLTLATFRREGLRAVLWHQGESDAHARTTRAAYEADLRSLIESAAIRAGGSVPWLVAKVSYSAELRERLCGAAASHSAACATLADAARAQITEAQKALVDGKFLFAGPDSDSLTGANRFDGVHFSVQGLAALAKLWDSALAQAFPQLPAGGSP